MIRRHSVLVATLTLALVLTPSVGLVGCTAPQGSNGSAESTVTGADTFSAQDLMFAQMMIPHHQQAVDMSALAETRTTNPEILDLARQISAAQTPEIAQMRAWLSAEGDNDGMGSMDMGMDHSMHMSGMLSEDQMVALSAASGTLFDRLYLEGMIEHHLGAIEMAQMIVESNNAEARTLGENIVASQTAEIEQMRQILASL